MQNRYVGDVGDFGKYGLLRWLCGMTGPELSDEDRLRLGVLWYLYHDFDSAGASVGYLAKPQDFSACDPDLYDFLGELVKYGNRNLRSVQQSGILPFTTDYYERSLVYPDASRRTFREALRRNWLEGAVSSVKESDFIFADPDVSIAGDRDSLTKKSPYEMDGPKYVFWEDLKCFWKEKKSLVIYNQMPRFFSDAENEERIRRICYHLGNELPARVKALYFTEGSKRAYFLACQSDPRHSILMQRMIAFLGDKSPWLGLFQEIS